MMKKTILLFTGLAFFTFKNQAQITVTDIDGNSYNTVTIGTQIWMAENLKVTHYPDGTAILYITDNSQWGNLEDNEIDDAYCYFNNDANGEADTYGALYTWAAAMGDNAVSSNSIPSGVQGVCPDGWHLPSDEEWTVLNDYLIDNGYNWDGTTSGNKVGKSMAATSGWNSSTTPGDVGNDQSSNNSTGFTGLSSGRRWYSSAGTFADEGISGTWWSTTESPYDTTMSYRRILHYSYDQLDRYFNPKSSGFSVRCVCDSTVSTSIKAIDMENRFHIYPNPATDNVYIINTDSKIEKVQIYNIIGSCVLQREINNDKNEINVSTLPKGLYVIKITGDNWTTDRKLMKK